MEMKLVSVSCAVLGALVAILPFGDQAHAEPIKCRAAILKASAKFAQDRTTLLQKCEDKVVKDTLPGPCPDTATVDKIAKAQTKLATSIAKACGGKDKMCGAGGDDDALAAIGWAIGTCPNFENGSCTNAIADCGGIALCVECVAGAAVDQGISLYYGFLRDTDPKTQKALNKCQQALGKESLKFLQAKSKALTKCWDKVNKSKATAPCPAPGDGQALASIQKAESNLAKALCKACGGADKQCDADVTVPSGVTFGPGSKIAGSGGTDDFAPLAIGFPVTCDDVTVPGGAACSGAVSTLAGLVKCAACVTEFKTDCFDRVAVPGLAAYPAECSLGATRVPLTDWSSTFTAWWSLDEASGTRVNNAGASSCGGTPGNCNLTQVGTVVNDTSNFQEGVAAASFDGSIAHLEDATDVIYHPVGQMTYGGWVRVDDESLNRVAVHHRKYGSGGYELTYFSGTDRLTCQADTSSVAITDANTVNTYAFAVCTWDGASLRAYGNGKAPEGPVLTTVTSISFPFSLGEPTVVATGEMLGELDEIGFVNGLALSDDAVCRWCSCGIRGEQCLCDGANPVQYADSGRNATACNSCALPVCNAPAPIVPTPTPSLTPTPTLTATPTQTFAP